MSAMSERDIETVRKNEEEAGEGIEELLKEITEEVRDKKIKSKSELREEFKKRIDEHFEKFQKKCLEEIKKESSEDKNKEEITLVDLLIDMEENGDEDDKKFVKELRERVYKRSMKTEEQKIEEKLERFNKGLKLRGQDGKAEIKLSEDMKATMEGRKRTYKPIDINTNDPTVCPDCSSAEIKTNWEHEHLNSSGQSLITSVPVRKCEGCGLRWIDSVGQDLIDCLIVAYAKDSDDGVYVKWEDVKKELKVE